MEPVCCKRLLYVVGFRRPSATTSSGQPCHQGTLTVQFKMASKMAAVVFFYTDTVFLL